MEGYIVEMDQISKSFPGVKALDDVSFRLRAGEVMALLGENGAGKSTLMKILSGVYTRDSGRIRVLGKEVEDLTPRKAQELGVAIIHQELNLCGHMTVAENIFLGHETMRKGLLNQKEMGLEAKKVLDELNMEISPDAVVGDLAVSKQQMIEIAKALSIDARILIMDEPTSALTSKEIQDLFAIIRKLTSQGMGIVYISHRLEELGHIVDGVTIMRDGRFITSMEFKDTNMKEIITSMVGREIKEKFPRVSWATGKKILEVRHLNAGPLVKDISLELYEGEIVGIAGLMGAGRTETTRAIFGVDKKESGEIYLDGEKVSIHNPMDAIRAGIVLAPEDRKKDGLCTKLSIRENIGLPNLDFLVNPFGVIKRKQEEKITMEAVDHLRIKVSSIENNADSLSGGNMQKVVVGKWLARKSRVVIFDEPTRGIDVGAKVEIYHLMNDLKKQGIGVLFVSSEMPEVIGISDRVIVMCDGRITGVFSTGEVSQDMILEYATRFESKLDNGPDNRGHIQRDGRTGGKDE